MLEDPKDLPEGTEATVKLQRSRTKTGGSWLVFAHGQNYAHFKILQSKDIPPWVKVCMEGRHSRLFQAVVKNGEWEYIASTEPENN